MLGEIPEHGLLGLRQGPRADERSASTGRPVVQILDVTTGTSTLWWTAPASAIRAA